VTRLGLLRLTVPLLLAGLVWLVWRSFEAPAPPRPHEPGAAAQGTRARDLAFVEFEGSSRSVAGHADLVAPGPDGRLHLEGVRDLAVERPGRDPVVVSADQGDRQGTEGAWRWRFAGRVTLRDEAQGLRLELPELTYDQARGEMRSAGDIRLEAPGASGHVESLVYGLAGQPGTLARPRVDLDGGGRLLADQARLLDGVRDLELTGAVRAERGDQTLAAARLRLLRPAGRLRRADAGGQVRGTDATGAAFGAEELAVTWDEQGQVEHAELSGDASVAHAGQRITATRIDAARSADGTWLLSAADGVMVDGTFGAGPGRLRAERLDGILDTQRALRSGQAQGHVSFESSQAQAEADHAALVLVDGAGEITLSAAGTRKASLSHGPTRVAAETITTDTRGQRLLARGRVEAVLLPGDPGRAPAAGRGLFVAGEAVHFVSAELRGRDAGARLTFQGGVRGWQGERHLAAEEVVVDQTARTLEARTAVSTRVPRERATAAPAEGDYLQVFAEHLLFREQTGRALFSGQARVSLREGWMEAREIEVELTAGARDVAEIRANGGVNVGLERDATGRAAEPVLATADRLDYRPAERVIRLHGDQAPASVRRVGGGGGTTTGRQLTYHLDSGALDVESGNQTPGRIRTGGP